jgi:hypothetical protein
MMNYGFGGMFGWMGGGNWIWPVVGILVIVLLVVVIVRVARR